MSAIPAAAVEAGMHALLAFVEVEDPDQMDRIAAVQGARHVLEAALPHLVGVRATPGDEQSPELLREIFMDPDAKLREDVENLVRDNGPQDSDVFEPWRTSTYPTRITDALLSSDLVVPATALPGLGYDVVHEWATEHPSTAIRQYARAAAADRSLVDAATKQAAQLREVLAVLGRIQELADAADIEASRWDLDESNVLADELHKAVRDVEHLIPRTEADHD